MNCTMSSQKLRKFPSPRSSPRTWPVARAPTVPVPNSAVLKLGLEVLLPGSADSGKGRGAPEEAFLGLLPCLRCLSAENRPT